MNQKLGESIARKAAIEIFFCDPVPTWQQVMEQMESRVDRGEGWEPVGDLLYQNPSAELDIPEVVIWEPLSQLPTMDFVSSLEAAASSIESAIERYLMEVNDEVS